MPMYTYRCSKCEYVFEDIKVYEKRDECPACVLCGGPSVRDAAELFGIQTGIDSKSETVYTDKEIDKVIGEAAEKKWVRYAEQRKNRKEKKWKGADPKPIEMPRDADGKIAPLMHLGNCKEKQVRAEFVSALQEHRAERARKKISQFDGPGSIE